MTDYKGCDVHAHGFPNNLVPAENVYQLSVSQQATVNKHKGTKFFELDMCNDELKELILARMSGLKLAPKWQFKYWGVVVDPQTKEEKRQQITEPIQVTS